MRFDDWESRLREYLREAVYIPFQYGVHDCFIFTGECVRAMTGDSYVDEIKGKYSTFEESIELARSHGFKSHIHFLARKFPLRPSRLHAQRGDIVLTRGLQDGPALGICQGERVYVAGHGGLTTTSLDDVRKVFAV